MKKSKFQLSQTTRKIIYTSIGVVFIFLVRELTAIGVNNEFIFPNLVQLGINFGQIFIDGQVWLAFLESFGRTILALLISFIFAFGFGLLGGLFDRFRYFFKPVVELLKLVPTPCIIFLIFLYLYKYPNLGSIIITSVVVFPILYESFVTGLVNIDDSIKMSLRLEGFYKPKSIFRIQVFEAMPYLLLGLVNTVGLGIKVSIVSEILLGSSKFFGIGSILYTYKFNAEFPKMFAIILLIVIMFLIFDSLLLIPKIAIKKYQEKI